MAENKKQAIVIETGELFTVEGSTSKMGIEFKLPPELEAIARKMMSDIEG